MLVPLYKMKEYLGISESDETHDGFLSQQLSLVSDTVEEYCRRKFKLATYKQTLYKNEIPDDYFLYEVTLRNFPMVSLTSALLKQKESDTGTDLEDIMEYRVHKPTSKIIPVLRQSVMNCYSILEVTYVAGHVSVPSPVLEVVYSIVKERYNKKVSGIDLSFGADIQRVSIPGTMSIDYDFSLDNNNRKSAFGVILGSYVNILDSYRSETAIIGSEELVYIEPA